MRVLLPVVVTLLAPVASAEQCESHGPVASMDVPDDGDVVAPSVRFRVGLYGDCGGLDPAPEHQLRILDAKGKEVPHSQERWMPHLWELVPNELLAAGEYSVQVKRPISSTELGEWETLLARVRVEGEPDRSAPVFEGIARTRADEVEGTRFLSPCEAYQGPVVSTRILFDAAVDKETEHSTLLYVLDRRASGKNAWEAWRAFRPHQESGRWLFEWKTEQGWGERWDYRIRVRDISGNETVGAEMASVRAPSRPSELDEDPLSLEPGAGGSAHCAATGQSPLSLFLVFVFVVVGIARGRIGCHVDGTRRVHFGS